MIEFSTTSLAIAIKNTTKDSNPFWSKIQFDPTTWTFFVINQSATMRDFSFTAFLQLKLSNFCFHVMTGCNLVKGFK